MSETSSSPGSLPFTECRQCGTVVPVPCTVPSEPPVGTWVRDRFGGLSRRTAAGWGLPGFMPFGVWSAMWHARGPLVECGPWGRDDEEREDMTDERGAAFDAGWLPGETR